MNKKEALLQGRLLKSVPKEQRPFLRSGFRFVKGNTALLEGDTIVVSETTDVPTGQKGMEFYSTGAKGVLRAMHDVREEDLHAEGFSEMPRFVALSEPASALLTEKVAKALGYVYAEITTGNQQRVQRTITLRPRLASELRKKA